MTDWDRIVREHGPMVFGTAWRILGHVADTEDVVQEVFFQAYRLRAVQEVRHWSGFLRQLASCPPALSLQESLVSQAPSAPRPAGAVPVSHPRASQDRAVR